MIARLKGIVEATAMDWVLVDIGGVGYKVEVPLGLAMRLVVGEEVTLWTYHMVREDQQALFGFETREALECFWQLITVSGVGPKMAQKILASYTPNIIAQAVDEGNDALFVRVSGVGKKTAQKIILDLRGSITFKPSTATAVSDTELVEALESLGYTATDSRKLAEKVPSEARTLEEKLRAILRQT